MQVMVVLACVLLGVIATLLLGVGWLLIIEPAVDANGKRFGISCLGIGSICIGIMVVIMQLSQLLSLPR
jgi:hypothetical protein